MLHVRELLRQEAGEGGSQQAAGRRSLCQARWEQIDVLHTPAEVREVLMVFGHSFVVEGEGTCHKGTKNASFKPFRS